MGNIFQADNEDKTEQNGIRSDKVEKQGESRHMMDEIIAALRALVNIFDLISRNLNRRK